MYALVDGNNFYVSCERVFRPSLIGRPVIVLSNNDGCAIARSNEAKDLGIRMGAPWFQIRHLEQQAGLVALSANFTLYGDMSDRMMSLAAGLGLAALASHLGLGEGFANILMIGLLVMAAIFVFRLLTRGKAAPQSGMNYAGAGAGQQGNNALRMPTPPVSGSAPAGGSMIGSAIGAGQPQQASIPADFDVAGFVRNAKVNYIRLQASYDAGNLDDIREFTSPEVFAEIQMDLRERAGATQRTEVEQLDAQVLEVVEEAGRYIVSVHFTGTVREDGTQDRIDEIWHLTKPRQGNGGWVLAGIQQA